MAESSCPAGTYRLELRKRSRCSLTKHAHGVRMILSKTLSRWRVRREAVALRSRDKHGSPVLDDAPRICANHSHEERARESH